MHLGFLVDFFDFLAALPEQEIWAYCRAENRDHHREAVGCQRKSWRDQSHADRTPIDLDREHHRYIGQKHQRQPFKISGIALVRHEQLQRQGKQSEDDREDVAPPANDQFGGCAHSGKVGADIDGVGKEEERYQGKNDRLGKHFSDVFGQPLSCHPSDLRADELHRRHQRIGQRHRPQHVVAELRPSL